MNKTNIHIILILTLMRDFSMEEKRTFLVELKPYDIEISYYKFNVISAFQNYRVLLLRTNFLLALSARVCVFSRALCVRSLRRSVRQGKEEKTESKNYLSNTI